MQIHQIIPQVFIYDMLMDVYHKTKPVASNDGYKVFSIIYTIDEQSSFDDIRTVTLEII